MENSFNKVMMRLSRNTKIAKMQYRTEFTTDGQHFGIVNLVRNITLLTRLFNKDANLVNNTPPLYI